MIEVALYESGLIVLQQLLDADDQEVEGWYLEGWCLFLMSQQAKEAGVEGESLTWEDLARDSKECLIICKNVSCGSLIVIVISLTCFIVA
jgi:hypothetical protein